MRMFAETTPLNGGESSLFIIIYNIENYRKLQIIWKKKQ